MLPMPAILVNTSPFPLMKVGPPMRLFMDKTVKQAAGQRCSSGSARKTAREWAHLVDL